MLNRILNTIFPDHLDKFRHVRPDLSAVDVPRVDKARDVRLPDVDGRVRVAVNTEHGMAWDADQEGRRMALTSADLDEMAVRGLADQDKIEIASRIKADVYNPDMSRSKIVAKYRGARGYSDGNIGKIMAALNAVRKNTPTPTEGRG